MEVPATTGEYVAPADLVRGLDWLGAATGTPADLDHVADALAGRALRLDTASGARAVQRCIADCGLPLAWTEVRLRDAGRHRPCLTVDRRTGAVVYVESQRWGWHSVRVILDGHVEHRLLSTRHLAALLEVAPSASITALAPSPRLPLEPLRLKTATVWGKARLLLGLDRSDIRLAFVYGIAIGVLSIVTPVAVQALVNTIALGALLQPLLVLTVLMALVLTFAGVVRVLQAYVVEAIQARMFVRATADVTRRLFAAPPTALDHASPAELTARFLEVPVLQKAVAILLVDGIDLLLKLIVGLTLLAVYHPTLMLFAAVMLVLLVVVVVVGGRGAIATALEESDAKYEIVGWLEQTVRLAGIVRTEAARRRALDRADHLARRYRDARRSHFSKLARHLSGAVAIQVVGSAALLGLGGALVVAGQLTLGQLVAAELVFTVIALALVKMHKQLEAVYDVVASSKKFAALVDVPRERSGGERLVGTGPVAIAISEATIAHDARSVVLRDASLEVAAGERLAIGGGAGTGKSTLLDVLAAAHHVSDGRITFDGLDLRQLSLGDLRAQIVCLRDVDREMASETIEANLRLARPDATTSDLDEVLRIVELADVVAQLPDGLATRLTRTGRPLSETAARRLAIARALLARPRLLLVDRGFDDLGLSPEAKDRVLDALFSRTDARTMVVVSDDPDVLRRCDRAVHLAGGQLVEVG